MFPPLAVHWMADCRKPVDVKLIVFGVVVGVLFIGILALLAWKAVVTVHDRREFARFQEEFKKSRWNVVSPHSTTSYYTSLLTSIYCKANVTRTI